MACLLRQCPSFCFPCPYSQFFLPIIGQKTYAERLFPFMQSACTIWRRAIILDMEPQRSLESVISRTTARPFRFKFSFLFIGITGAIAYINSMEGCRSDLPIDAAYGIGVLLMILLGLEWFEQNRFQSLPPLTALALLAFRMALIEGIVALDCSHNALFLYAMVPYSAYFTLGSRASVATSLFYILLVLWRSGDSGGSELLGFGFVMMFVPLIAYIIRKDDENRAHTEDLLADLEASHLQLQAYTEQVAELSAAEERYRLARDIHDSLGHYLTAVNIQLEKALLYQERNPGEATQAIRDAKQAAADALSDVRRSVGALRQSQDRFLLSEALERLAQGVEDDQLVIDFQVLGDESGYARSTLMALYRAAQEGLTNIQKHARASHVHLEVDFGPQEAVLRLQDDGRGFSQDFMAPENTTDLGGFGLRGLRERLDLLRGRLDVHSIPDHGTELVVVAPKSPFSLRMEGREGSE